MMQTYAEVAGLPRRLIVPVPVLTPRLSSLWVGLVTPLPAGPGPAAGREPDQRGRRDPADRPARRSSTAEPLGVPARRRAGAASGSADAAGRHPVVRRRPARADRRPTRCRPIPTGPAAACSIDEQEVESPTPPADAVLRHRRPASAATGAGTSRRCCGASAAGSTSSSAGSGCGGAGATPTSCGSATPSTSGGSRPWSRGELLRLRAEMRLPGEAWLEWTHPADRRPAAATSCSGRSSARGASGGRAVLVRARCRSTA